MCRRCYLGHLAEVALVSFLHCQVSRQHFPRLLCGNRSRSPAHAPRRRSIYLNYLEFFCKKVCCFHSLFNHLFMSVRTHEYLFYISCPFVVLSPIPVRKVVKAECVQFRVLGRHEGLGRSMERSSRRTRCTVLPAWEL